MGAVKDTLSFGGVPGFAQTRGQFIDLLADGADIYDGLISLALAYRASAWPYRAEPQIPAESFEGGDL